MDVHVPVSCRHGPCRVAAAGCLRRRRRGALPVGGGAVVVPAQRPARHVPQEGAGHPQGGGGPRGGGGAAARGGGAWGAAARGPVPGSVAAGWPCSSAIATSSMYVCWGTCPSAHAGHHRMPPCPPRCGAGCVDASCAHLLLLFTCLPACLPALLASLVPATGPAEADCRGRARRRAPAVQRRRHVRHCHQDGRRGRVHRAQVRRQAGRPQPGRGELQRRSWGGEGARSLPRQSAQQVK